MKISPSNSAKNSYRQASSYADASSSSSSGDSTSGERFDTITLSKTAEQKQAEQQEKARALIEQREQQLEQKQAELENLRADLEASKEEVEATAEAFDILLKCLKISGNIISGDNVPPSDHQFLMENDMDLYSMSISARIRKPKPEDLKAVVKREKSEMEQEIERAMEAEMPEISSPVQQGQVAPEQQAETSEIPA